MEQYIKYGEFINCSRVLGPGKRFILWVQGCCFSCEGCIAQSYRSADGKKIRPNELAEIICGTSNIEGLTISGGEPFLQASALLELLRLLKVKTNLNIVIYTGFLYEELLRGEGAAEQYIPDSERNCIVPLLEQTDLLIDGPYQKELDNGRSQVGSANQRVLNLSGNIPDEVIRRTYGSETRKIEIFFRNQNTILCGVPDEKQRKLWETMKREVLK